MSGSKKIGFVFPGQGSQYSGMGKDIFNNFTVAREVFENAEDILKKDIKRLCFDSTQDELSFTDNAQISIFVLCMAIYRVLLKLGVDASVFAGNSLGELCALCCGGVFSLEDGFNIVYKRGQLMMDLASKQDGGMYAILGLDDNTVIEICKSVDGMVSPVNYNCPNQVIISGERSALLVAGEFLKKAGARRVIPLNLSGAFHTNMMIEAAHYFYNFLSVFNFYKTTNIIYSNISGGVFELDTDYRDYLKRHIISPVLWSKQVINMKNDGYSTFIEVGGNVLTGFSKKISADITCYSIQNLKGIKKITDILK